MIIPASICVSEPRMCLRAHIHFAISTREQISRGRISLDSEKPDINVPVVTRCYVRVNIPP